MGDKINFRGVVERAKMWFERLLRSFLSLTEDKRTLERPSPRDIVKYNQISWTADTLTIKDIPSITIASIADTNSMDGLMDVGHNALLISKFDKDKLAVGDIIVFRPTEHDKGQIIHRITRIWTNGNDGEWYCYTKGDNNYSEDPYRVRKAHIRFLCVGIIY